MNSFDKILKSALLTLEEENYPSSSSPNPLQGFLNLNPEQRKIVADIYKNISANVDTDNVDHLATLSPEQQSALNAYASNKLSGNSKTTQTLPNQTQSTSADSSGSNQSGVTGTPKVPNPIIP